MDEFHLITVDPGHFHAALIQKEMYSRVSKRAVVYAPLGPDLTVHLNRIAGFNLRKQNPTAWELDIHTSPAFLERMAEEGPGNVVVLSGKNRDKIKLIQAALDAGLHVLADKPWIIRAEDLGALETALATAEKKELVAYDIMTERYEITSILQKELVNDPGVFGNLLPGTQAEPAVYMESVHHLLKYVSGLPNPRPAWFFDVELQGEALADVGTHLVDLTQWTLFPDQKIDAKQDIAVLGAERWPTKMTAAQFKQVTGEAGPDLDYYCNTRVSYTVRGIHVKLDVLWRWEAPAGAGDTHLAIYRGSKARVEVRQGVAESYRPELYVVPSDAGVEAALRGRIGELSKQWPGIGVEPRGTEFLVTIPDAYRNGHEAHFAQVANRFFAYLGKSEPFPEWENPNMMAKYSVSTLGTALSRKQS
jgi:predicted dehydrogenase